MTSIAQQLLNNLTKSQFETGVKPLKRQGFKYFMDGTRFAIIKVMEALMKKLTLLTLSLLIGSAAFAGGNGSCPYNKGKNDPSKRVASILGSQSKPGSSSTGQTGAQ